MEPVTAAGVQSQSLGRAQGCGPRAEALGLAERLDRVVARPSLDVRVFDVVLFADDQAVVTGAAGRAELRIVGEVDVSNAAALRSVLMVQPADSTDGLQVDASGLRFIDACGLRAVVEVAGARPHAVRFVNATPAVLRLVAVCGWDQLPELAFVPGEGSA